MNTSLYLVTILLSITTAYTLKKWFTRLGKFDAINYRSVHKARATKTGGITVFTTLFLISIYEWKSYYNDLMSLRNSLKGALGQRSNETLGASARESSGELSINSSDSGTETFNRDVALSMVASEQEALEEIEDAIDRIFDGSFGICQETEKPIKKTRLKVVPFTRFSLEGQTLYEKRKRKKHDNGGGIFATISDSTMGQDD